MKTKFIKLGSPFQIRKFKWFFIGQSVSLFGTAMAPIALTLAILDVDSNKLDLGLILAARTIPLLFFLIFAGIVADRFPRKIVLSLANIGSGITQACVYLLFLFHQYSLEGIGVLEFINGVLSSFTIPALRGIIPSLVVTTQLKKANSLLSLSKNVAKIFGPTLGGIFAISLGSGIAIFIDSLSYFIAAFCLIKVNVTELDITNPRTSSFSSDLVEGWNTYRKLSWVWKVSFSFCIINLVQAGSWFVLGPSLMKQSNHESLWGLTLSTRGIGLVVGGYLIYKFAIARLLLTGQLVSILGALPISALGMHLSPWVIIFCAFSAGIGLSIFSVCWSTSLQEHIPPNLVSRVISFDEYILILFIFPFVI